MSSDAVTPTSAPSEVARRQLDLEVLGIALHGEQAGQGAPLVYLHGLEDLGEWPLLLDALAERFTVVRLDHPGFNASGDDERITDMRDLAFFYLDVLDALAIERAVVVGAGIGGWLGAELASLAHERVEALVLIGAAGLRPEGAPDLFLMDPGRAAALGFSSPQAKAQASEAAAALLGDPERFARYLRNRAATAHLGWSPYLHDPSLPHRLHRVSAPTLVLSGARDEVIPPACAERYGALIGHARVALVADAGHLVHLERPDAVAELVTDFLAAERA